MIDGLLAIEPDAHAGADHHDAEGVPLAGRLVGQDERVLAGLAGGIVPKGAGTELAAVLEGLFVGRVPDLDLRGAAEVDAGIALRGHVVFEGQFEVAVVFVGRGVGSGAGVVDLAVFRRPMLRELLAHLLQHGVLFLARELGDAVGVISVPAGEVLAIEQRSEAGGDIGGDQGGGRESEEGGEEAHD